MPGSSGERSRFTSSRCSWFPQAGEEEAREAPQTANSVNVSATLVIDRLSQTRLAGLGRATHLIQEHSARLGHFLTEDPQGQMLPGYLSALYTQLQAR